MKCIYCLQEADTKDHFFPQSWYPKTTESYIEKWSAPACYSCNQKMSRAEEKVMTLFALCLDPNQEETIGIYDKVKRSIDPKCGRDSKDRANRQRKKDWVLKYIKNKEIFDHGYLPGFGPEVPWSQKSHLAITFPADLLELMGTRLIKGTLFKLTGKYVDRNYDIGVYFVNNSEEIKELKNKMKIWGQKYHRGPGWQIVFANTKDDPIVSLFHFTIWGRWEIYGSTTPHELPPNDSATPQNTANPSILQGY